MGFRKATKPKSYHAIVIYFQNVITEILRAKRRNRFLLNFDFFIFIINFIITTTPLPTMI